MKTARLLLLSLALAAAQAPAQGLSSKERVLWSRLEADVDRVLAATEAVVGVALTDLASGTRLDRHSDETFAAASVIKLAVLAELYRQEEQGRSRFSDSYVVEPRDLVPDSRVLGNLTPGLTRVTNRDLAAFTVVVSDNSATNVLIDRLGFDRINALLEELALQKTRLRRKMMDLEAARAGRENTGTPREFATLLEALYRGRLAGPKLTEDLLELLKVTKESYIPDLLPPGVPVANKPGELEGVRHDAGIVYATNRPFVLVVMTSHARDERAAEATIARIAAAAHDCLDRIGRATPHGRLLTPPAGP